MLIKNQIYEAVICDYTAEGMGVAKIEGCAVFIPNAIRGERVKVRIEKAQKTWAAGKITEILEKSPHRVNRECPVAKLCGGCDFWHMDYAEETLRNAGYEPYYLYRQKYMAGGLENVGFCKKGTASHYNICMMEELSDVIALGSGGVSKLCSEGGRKVNRVANPKFPKEYIERIETIADGKAHLLDE